MYYEYWGLKKPPFDNVPDPSMYVDCHPSMENALAEALFAIEEGNECLAVIIGDVGLGKTLSLRMIIDNLDQEKYAEDFALVTNPSISFTQLIQEMIGQLTAKQVLEKRKAVLLELFNKVIFETMDEGKKVVLLIDEANAMASASLENLRLLTNMQDDQRNLFTMVLAGRPDGIGPPSGASQTAQSFPADRDLQSHRQDSVRGSGQGLCGKADCPGWRRPAYICGRRLSLYLGTFRPRGSPIDQ